MLPEVVGSSLVTATAEPASIAIDGSKMRALRKDKLIGINAFAERIDVTPGYISMIETGRRRVSPEVFLRICDALEIPASRRQRLTKADKS